MQISNPHLTGTLYPVFTVDFAAARAFAREFRVLAISCLQFALTGLALTPNMQ